MIFLYFNSKFLNFRVGGFFHELRSFIKINPCYWFESHYLFDVFSLSFFRQSLATSVCDRKISWFPFCVLFFCINAAQIVNLGCLVRSSDSNLCCFCHLGEDISRDGQWCYLVFWVVPYHASINIQWTSLKARLVSVCPSFSIPFYFDLGNQPATSRVYLLKLFSVDRKGLLHGN